MEFLAYVVVAVPFGLFAWWRVARWRPEWQARDIHLGVWATDVAVVVGFLAGLLACAQWGAAAGVAASMGFTYLTIAAVTDYRTRLIPRDPTWFLVGGGVVLAVIYALLTGTAMLTLLIGPLVVAVLAAILFVVGGGAGDARMLFVMAATMWWMPPVVLLLAACLIFPLSLLFAFRREGNKVPLAPGVFVAFTLALAAASALQLNNLP